MGLKLLQGLEKNIITVAIPKTSMLSCYISKLFNCFSCNFTDLFYKEKYVFLTIVKIIISQNRLFLLLLADYKFLKP
jgi:hypothetical protein